MIPFIKIMTKSTQRNTRILEKQADCIISAIDHVEYLERVDYYFHLRCIDTSKKSNPALKLLEKFYFCPCAKP